MYEPNEYQVWRMFEHAQEAALETFAAPYAVQPETDFGRFIYEFNESIDWLDFCFRVEKATGVSMDDWMHATWSPERQRWERAATKGYPCCQDRHEAAAQRFGRPTFRGLALYLASRKSPEEYHEFRWWGRPCKVAGAFQLLQEITMRITGNRPTFGPSDRIETGLKQKEVRLLWDDLRWRTRNALPPLRTDPQATIGVETYRDLAEVVAAIHPAPR